MTFGPFTQLEVVNTIGDKEILQIQMEHKVKIVEVLERHKIRPKAKAHMSIPFCLMISMPVVWLAFKIDVFKIKQTFQMGY